MKTKNVLGLDIGTNSIGWALIKLPENFEDYGKEGKIELLGSRILPDSDYKKAFEEGKTNSQKVETPAATRRKKRGSRRLKHRYKLRRTRLIKVFKVLNWLDNTFPEDFKKAGKNAENSSIKISDFLVISDETYKEFYRDFGYSETEIIKILEEIKYRNQHKKPKDTSIKLLPEDWIVYYLRKKSLSEKIEISELARIIYMFNQRRGFQSSRKDLKDTHVLPYDEFIKRKESTDFGENGIETKFVTITKVEKIEQLTTEPDKNGKYKFKITLEDKRVEPYEINYKVNKKNSNDSSVSGPDWIGKEFTFIVTQKVDKNGKFTQLKPQIPNDDDWSLCTLALDEKIQSSLYPGKYFYDELVKAFKEKRSFKIRQYPVYRWRYKQELETIWKKQCELNPELLTLNNDKDLLRKLAEVLYPTQSKYNLPKLKEFLSHDLLHIISNDIIYYQRELKSQKNLIKECRYEKRIGKEKDENGNFIETGKYGLKCIPKSSPLFQEFRIWQDIHNIRIFKREEVIDGKINLDVDCTSKYINNEVKADLFRLFNEKANVNEKDILKIIKEKNPNNDIIISKNNKNPHSHRINLFSNRDSLKGNETKARYRDIFKKAKYDGIDLLNNLDFLINLWHADYSITSSDEEKSKKGITTALTKLLPDKNNKDKVIELFLKLPELKKEYGSYSAKAIKKLLPLMRIGEHWNINNIDESTKNKIQKILENSFDEIIDEDIKSKLNRWKNVNNIELKKIEDFQGLPTWLACYVVYGTHSENEIEICKSADEFNDKVIQKLKNNSLRNPVVEQVVRETLLIVRDIWKVLETKKEKIDEIHIELGRDLKNNSEEKQKIANAQKKNFEEKQKIKSLLKELINNGFTQYNIDEQIEQATFEVTPNPENPADIEKFRIWKDCSSYSHKEHEEKWKELFKDKSENNEKKPNKSDIEKYILWLSQKCRSPYSGKIIPLSKLFDPNEYEIEHIIPRSKLKNDSKNNLVICELGINKAKSNKLAANFIRECNGICKHENKEYTLLKFGEYVEYVKETFKYNKSKLKNLLATEVPEDFVERQLNNTRYINRKVVEFLKPVVGDENKIIYTGGIITSELKENWGLNKEWKKLMLPRFERLQKITGKSYIKQNENDRNEIDIQVPENENLDIKRIDHRHHALDALVIAATTREHIRYLNSLNAVDNNEELKKVQTRLVKGKIRDFKLPWETFTKEAREKLEELIVSFKVNNRIVSKPRNLYTVWKEIGGKVEKIYKEQEPNKKWLAIRRSLFKEPMGIVWLKQIKKVSVKEAFEIEIDRQLKSDNPIERKTASYIYDKIARQTIKDIISKCSASICQKNILLDEINFYLKKNKKDKDTYILNGIEFKKITIAEFHSYKTKRTPLINNKEYTDGLNLKKIINDFPYFNFIGKDQFECLDERKKKIILEHNNKEKEKIIISENKKMSPINYLFLNHILEYNNDPKEAFSSEGIDALNKKALKILGKEIKYITRLDGVVDTKEILNGGYYEPDKGSMAYFVIYENEETGNRDDFISIPTHEAIKKIIENKPIAEDREEYRKIILSPGDIVYVPTKEDREKIKKGYAISNIINLSDKKNLNDRLFRVGKFTGKQCYFLKSNIAELIISYDKKTKIGEFGSQNCQEFNDDTLKISNVCIKVNIDRLGNLQF